MSNILDNITKSKSSAIEVEILTKEELMKCESLSDAIRKCVSKDPNYSSSTIAKFLSKHRTKEVRVQHVYNVRNQKLKRK